MRFHKYIEIRAVPFFLYILGVLCCLVSGVAQAADATDEGLEISGLVLDETKTKPGRDFYEYFTTYWQDVEGLHYTIIVLELADSTRGSFVLIKVNDEVVYRNRLPRPDIIEEQARRAVSRVGVYMLRQLTVQKHLEEEFQY
jgi:curli production assembly/transport component CsgE